MQQIIKAQTTATTSAPVQVSRQRITFVSSGLASGEAIAVQIQTGLSAFANLSQEGVAIELTSGNNAITLEGPGVYRLNKPVTAGSAGVVIFSE